MSENILIIAAVMIALAAAGLLIYRELSNKYMFIWLGEWFRGAWREPATGPIHVLFCFVDHYEPQWRNPDRAQEDARVDRWVRDYPRLARRHKDADGRHPTHTFFYPEEEYRPEHLDKIQALCEQGLGEIEIHLHHDRDTAAGLRSKLDSFIDTLHHRHGALPLCPETRKPLFAFIHGNYALDNAREDGCWCGVNNELIVLREAGCYADFTLPSAPSDTQTRKINAIYYAKDDPVRPKSHDSGRDVRVGGQPWGDLMILQGPLALNWRRRKWGIFPKIENADIRAANPPTPDRVDLWVRTGVHVRGRPEWVFVKVHTHGTQEGDMDTLLGQPVDDMFSYLEQRYNDGEHYRLHYVTSREMYNISKAAEAGEQGDPGQYRDYLLPRPKNFKPDGGEA